MTIQEEQNEATVLTIREFYAALDLVRKDIVSGFEALRAEMRTSYATRQEVVDKLATSEADRIRLWKELNQMQCNLDEVRKLVWKAVGGLAAIVAVTDMFLRVVK